MMEEMEYLRLPPILAKQVQHPEEYIRKNDPKEPVRRIFKNVPISQDERKLLQQLKDNLAAYKIEINPDSQTDEVLLRYLYANNFNIENTKDMLRSHLSWLREPKNYEFDQDVLDIYNKGIVYILGRDKQYRPTLIINCDQITTVNVELLKRALSILCIIMEDYCFFDGKIENWNIIIDLKEKCVLNVKLQEYYSLFQLMYQNFPCTVDKIFILHPSLSIQLGWAEFLEHVFNKKKIIIVSDINQFKKYYEPTQLERKYGGRIEVKKYFPPLNTIPEGKQLTEPLKLLESMNQQQQQQIQIQTKQSIQAQNTFQETVTKQVQPTETLKMTKSKIERDFSVYPQQEVNDFKVYRPTEISKEPIKNISKYNRLTQAEIMKKEYEFQVQQTILQQKQAEVMKSYKYKQSQMIFEGNEQDEILSEQIRTQTVKPQSVQGQPQNAKGRLTAEQAEEDNAACIIF
ncbi:unnamed protein product [Paramecium octaurelia]|uniref:CRAL/TRIO N-terminal domain-containing protein n=1 Tax=Paramecium octaurelia TaxID=43137 RepID=A0A8S1X5V4_PAROT|nr:unnamed protein product [Paramecium octaurelia]